MAILREGLGRVARNTFVIAPLWVAGVGCLGLVTLADLPYVRPRVTQTRKWERRRRQPTGGFDGNSGAPPGDTDELSSGSPCPYVVGEGFIEFAKRVGIALGTAVHRIRCRAFLAAIAVEVGEVRRDDGIVESPGRCSPQEPPPIDANEVVIRKTHVLLWPTDFEVTSYSTT